MTRLLFRYLRPFAAVVAVACAPSSKDHATSDTAASMSTAAAHPFDDQPAAGAAAVATPSGMPADQEFLRMMADHHKGLILMAHETMERKDKLGSATDAKKLDQEQDADLDRIASALKGMNDNYTPKAGAEAERMTASLMKLSGTEFDHAFWQNTIDHHRQGVQMIDKYLPNLTHPDVKTLAQRMRSAQVREIAEMTKKLGGA